MRRAVRARARSITGVDAARVVALVVAVAGPAVAVDGGAPADVSVTARVEPPVVPLGEPFALVVEIVRPRGLDLELPGAIPERPTVRRGGPVRRAVTELGGAPPMVKERIEIPLLALDVEASETPAITLVAAGGLALDVEALPFTVDPQALLVDAGPEELAFAKARTHHVFYVRDDRPLAALASVGICGIAFALGELVRRRRRYLLPASVVVAPPTTKAPPVDEEALRRLDALLAEDLLTRGEIARFVARLMDEVLRFYLEGRFALPASTSTTRELAVELLRLSAPGLDVARLEAILDAADLVKFAKAELAVASAHDMAVRVRDLVEHTRERRAEVQP